VWYHPSVSPIGIGTAFVIAIVIFRYWGTPQSTSTQELPGGQFTLGGVNTSLFTGEINYIPLSEVSWWTIPMDSVVVNGQEITLPANVKNAIIDTGTTLVGEWKTRCGLPGDVVLILLAVMKVVRRRCWTSCLLE
jgi:hypothetical protein